MPFWTLEESFLWCSDEIVMCNSPEYFAMIWSWRQNETLLLALTNDSWQDKRRGDIVGCQDMTENCVFYLYHFVLFERKQLLNSGKHNLLWDKLEDNPRTLWDNFPPFFQVTSVVGLDKWWLDCCIYYYYCRIPVHISHFHDM